MTQIHIVSVSAPLGRSGLYSAAQLLNRAHELGLLPDRAQVTDLDTSLIRSIAGELNELGVALSASVLLAAQEADTGAVDLDTVVAQLAAAANESPIPEREWPSVLAVLEPELTAQLLDVSEASLRRYAAGQRATPDEVAGRLHYLSVVISYLRGAYNDYGVRRWFARGRPQLDGAAPQDLLVGDWSPDGAAAQSIRALADALLDAPAT